MRVCGSAVMYEWMIILEQAGHRTYVPSGVYQVSEYVEDGSSMQCVFNGMTGFSLLFGAPLGPAGDVIGEAVAADTTKNSTWKKGRNMKICPDYQMNQSQGFE